MIDFLIDNAKVIDGTGKRSFYGMVGIEGEKIAYVGGSNEAVRRNSYKIFDAHRRFVAPGFIDILRHADSAVFRPGFGEAELRQGITTIVCGGGGMSIPAIEGEFAESICRHVRPILGKVEPKICALDFASYLRQIQLRGIPLNFGVLAGGGTIFASLFGFLPKKLAADEKRLFCEKIEKALSDGALGISLGLNFAPEISLSAEQIADCLSPLKSSPVPLAVRARTEAGGLLDAIDEIVFLAKKLGTPINISPLRAAGRENWREKFSAVLEKIEKAKNDGADISCGVCPYESGAYRLDSILPPEFRALGEEAALKKISTKEGRKQIRAQMKKDGCGNFAAAVGWENIKISSASQSENRRFVGMTIEKAAQSCAEDPLDFACGFLASEGFAASSINSVSHEYDVLRALRADFSNVVSDAAYPSEGTPHPCAYGAFARVLEKYARSYEISIEDAVFKQSAAPARAMRIEGKGRLAEGFDADVLIFDLENVCERATDGRPCRLAEGLDCVFVNGKPAIMEGKYLGGGIGKTLSRKPR